jgi:hypothetical protein
MTTKSSCRRGFVLACAAMLGTAMLATSAAAVTSAQQSAIRANCRDDFMAHCSGVTPGGKDALVCLQKNVASLSPACKSAVDATLGSKAPAAKAATAPMAPPPGAVGNEPAFVPGAALILKACARTVLLHCHHMGEGRAVACIKAWSDSGHFIGFRCKAALKVQSKL